LISATHEPAERPVTCPYCDSTESELFSLYGSTLLSSQYVCRACHTVFDVVRFDDEDSDHYSLFSDR
jgi:ring-1,2-phenylacetyl-CoA epoxidase subunit PaaD